MRRRGGMAWIDIAYILVFGIALAAVAVNSSNIVETLLK